MTNELLAASARPMSQGQREANAVKNMLRAFMLGDHGLTADQLADKESHFIHVYIALRRIRNRDEYMTIKMTALARYLELN